MGILNVTPDSFSDGGRYASPEAAVARGRQLAAAGADLVDVGGESTRPGAHPVPVDEELRRVVPVVAALAADGICVSVDTRRPEVAAAAIEAGAEVVNDVSGLADPAMRRVCAETGVGVVVMHMRGEPATMQDDPSYDDVVAEVAAFLAERTARAEGDGIERDRIVVDPGIGFGKTGEHNLALLADLGAIVALGHPVLVGVSRKRFLGAILAEGGFERPPADRDVASAAAAVAAVLAGASIVRVHDVVVSREATLVADAIVHARRVKGRR
ncbi:MAG TPA: dihydropteroate synthase [Actinobacteria bacterium]|nr:dihydropteroate synthase [Actinomycetota bacterium]